MIIMCEIDPSAPFRGLRLPDDQGVDGDVAEGILRPDGVEGGGQLSGAHRGRFGPSDHVHDQPSEANQAIQGLESSFERGRRVEIQHYTPLFPHHALHP